MFLAFRKEIEASAVRFMAVVNRRCKRIPWTNYLVKTCLRYAGNCTSPALCVLIDLIEKQAFNINRSILDRTLYLGLDLP